MQKCFGSQQKNYWPSTLSIIHLITLILDEESNYSIFEYSENEKNLILNDYSSILCQLSQIHLYIILVLYVCLILWSSIQLFVFKKSNNTINLTSNLAFPLVLLLCVNNFYKNYSSQAGINFRFLVQIILLIIVQVLFLISQFSICIRETSSKNATKVHLNKWYYLLQFTKIHASIILPIFGVNFTVFFLLILGLSLIKTYLYKNSITYEQPLHQYIGYIGQIYCYLSLLKILLIYTSMDVLSGENDSSYLPIIISVISFLICSFFLIKKNSPILVILQKKYLKFMKLFSISNIKSLKKYNGNNQNFLVVFSTLLIQQLFPNNSEDTLPFNNAFKYSILESFQRQVEQIQKLQKQQQQKLANNFFSIRNLKHCADKKKLTIIIDNPRKSLEKQSQSTEKLSFKKEEEENEQFLQNSNHQISIQNMANYKQTTNQNLFTVQEQMNSSDQTLYKEGLSLCLINKIVQQEKKAFFISNFLISQNGNNSKEIVALIWKLISLNIKNMKDKTIKRQFISSVCYTMSFLKQSPKSKLFQTFYQNFDENMNFCQQTQYEINHRILLQKVGNLPQNSSSYQNTFKNQNLKNAKKQDIANNIVQFFSNSQVQLMSSFKQFFKHNQLVFNIIKSFLQIIKIQQKKIKFFDKKVQNTSKICQILVETHSKKEKLKEQLQSLKSINQLNSQYMSFNILYDLYVEKHPNFIQISQLSLQNQCKKKKSFLQEFAKIEYKNNIPICIVSGLANKGKIISSNIQFKQLFSSDILQNQKNLNINEFLPQSFQKQHRQAINRTFDKYEIQKMIDIHSFNQQCVIVSKVNNYHYEAHIKIHSYLSQLEDYNFLIQFVKLNKLERYQVKWSQNNKILYNYNEENSDQNSDNQKIDDEEQNLRRHSTITIGNDLSVMQTLKNKVKLFGKYYKITKQIKKTDGQSHNNNENFLNIEDNLSKITQKMIVVSDQSYKQARLSYFINQKLVKNNKNILFSKLWPFVIFFPLFYLSNFFIISNLNDIQDVILHDLKQQMNIFKFSEEQYLLNSVYAPIDILMKYKISQNQFNITSDQKFALINIIDESITLTNAEFDDLVLQVSSYDPQNTILFYQMFYPNKTKEFVDKNYTSYYMNIINQKFAFIEQIQIMSSLLSAVGFSSGDEIVHNQVQEYLASNINFLTNLQNKNKYSQKYNKYAQLNNAQHMNSISSLAIMSIVLLVLTYFTLFVVYYKIKKIIYLFLEPIVNLNQKHVKNIEINAQKLKNALQNFYSNNKENNKNNKSIQGISSQNQTIKFIKTQQALKQQKNVQNLININAPKTIKFYQQSYISFLFLLLICAITFTYTYLVFQNVTVVSKEIDTYIQGEVQFVKYLTYSADSFKILASNQYGNYSQISNLYLQQVSDIFDIDLLEIFIKVISNKELRQQIIFGPICSQMSLICTGSQIKQNFNIFMVFNQNTGFLRFLHSEIWENYKNKQQSQGQSQRMCLQAYKTTTFARKIGLKLLDFAHQFTNSKIVNFDDTDLLFSFMNIFVFISLIFICINLYQLFSIYQSEVLTFINFKDMREIQSLNFYINKQIDSDLKQKQFAKILEC